MAISIKNGNGESNSTTAVTVLAAPSATGVTRILPPGGLTIYNADTVAATVTIRYSDGANKRNIKRATLNSDEAVTNDGPIHLEDTDDSLEIILAAAITTNQLPWVVNYIEKT